jgi:hypothetical protein
MLPIVIVAGAVVAAAVLLQQVASRSAGRPPGDRELRAVRQRVADARKAVSQGKKETAIALKGPRSAVRRAQSDHDARLAAASRLVDSLEYPGRGAHLGSLGPVDLHAHALLVHRAEVDILGAVASCRVDGTTVVLDVRLADGRVIAERFDTTLSDGAAAATGAGGSTATRERVGLGTEERVAAFARAVTDQAVEHERFLADARVRLPEARMALDRHLADTAALDAARAALAAAEAASPAMQALEAARAELVRAEAAYAASGDAVG